MNMVITCEKCDKPAQVIFMGWKLCTPHANAQLHIEQKLEDKRHYEELAKIANEYREALERGMGDE